VHLLSAGDAESNDGIGLSTPFERGTVVTLDKRSDCASLLACVYFKDTLSCSFYARTYSYALHHLISVVELFPIVPVEFSIIFSVYIAVLWWHCMPHRVWQVSRQRYIFTWFVVLRCLRDLRGDVEAKQGKVHARLANELEFKSERLLVDCGSLHGKRSGPTPNSARAPRPGSARAPGAEQNTICQLN
jgi:hypothetical protein